VFVFWFEAGRLLALVGPPATRIMSGVSMALVSAKPLSALRSFLEGQPSAGLVLMAPTAFHHEPLHHLASFRWKSCPSGVSQDWSPRRLVRGRPCGLRSCQRSALNQSRNLNLLCVRAGHRNSKMNCWFHQDISATRDQT
jgi:hypothetical protein